MLPARGHEFVTKIKEKVVIFQMITRLSINQTKKTCFMLLNDISLPASLKTSLQNAANGQRPEDTQRGDKDRRWESIY